jgi:putative Mg2+ transporter-C (MgtC) family protein
MDFLLGNWQTQLTVIATTAYAMLLGGALGYERELKNRPAGFRTHMLIAGAAALLVGLGDLLSEHFSAESYRGLIQLDPLRLIEATVAAVGFLGAGAIFRRGSERAVEGLTTAASMLMAAAIGLAAGLHNYVLGLGATLLTLFVLRILGWFEPSDAIRKPPRGPSS